MSDDKRKEFLSNLISTTKLLNYPKIKELLNEFPNHYVIEAVRTEIQKIRDTLLSVSPEELEAINISPEGIEERVIETVCTGFLPSVRTAINATGIILHTALGRAPFADEAKESLKVATEGYCTLEVDLPTGKRGDRYLHVEGLLRDITGAESACIVNNNAAAVLLVLNTLAEGKEVIISRGQLIEIGGSFRIPDVMRWSGVKMIEVGATNRTHLYDYEKAVAENTAVILVAHTSNYKIMGFTKQVPLQELKSLCVNNNIILVADLGSGALVDLKKYNLPAEPTAQESLRAGANVISFSGDKLLGGPQCGIIIGDKVYIDRIRKNPLCRALRCDKMIYAVLEATLKLFLDEKTLLEKHPVLRLATIPVKTIAKRAQRFVNKIKPSVNTMCSIEIINDYSQMGSGSLPAENIPTKCIAFKPYDISPEQFAYNLRMGSPPVITRISESSVIFDFRTILPGEMNALENAVIKAINKNKYNHKK